MSRSIGDIIDGLVGPNPGDVNRTHFKNTCKKTSDKNGFYKRKGFRNWRCTYSGKKRTFVKMKDNGNQTFTAIPKGLLSRKITGSWHDLESFE